MSKYSVLSHWTRTQWDKAILVACLITDRIGLSLLYIVFAPLVRLVDLSEAQFGVLMASANVALAIASPFWGRMSQRLGRKPVLMIGLTGYSLGFIALALVLQAGLWGWLSSWSLFFMLLIVRIFYGLVAAGTQPAATAYMADVTLQHERAQGMALIGVASGVGTVLGPALGGILVGFGAVVPLYAAGLMSAVAVIVILVWLREPDKHSDQQIETDTSSTFRMTDGRILPYLVGWFVVVLVLTGIQTVTAFLIEDRFGITGAGSITRAATMAFLAMGGTMLFVQAVVLQKFRIAPGALLKYGFAILGLGLLVLIPDGHVTSLYLAYALMGAGYAAINPGLNAAASLSVSRQSFGHVAGLLAAAPVLGMVAGPLIATLCYSIDPIWPVIGGVMLSIGMSGYFFSRRAVVGS